MRDRSVEFSFTLFAAVACTLIGVALAGLNFWQPHDKLGFVALEFAAAAVALWVRSFLCEMTTREVAAFRLGQESARAAVHPVSRL